MGKWATPEQARAWWAEYEKRPYVRAYRRAYRQKPEMKLKAAEAKRRQRAAIRAFLDSYKLEKGCIDCGYRDHPAALEFDHVGPKKFTVSLSLQVPLSIDTIKAEIANCEVRCANCHRVRTNERRLKEAL